MNWEMWIKGLVLGFSIAAPVGPIGVLCIRRSLADGRLRGFVSGLGAATADACYGALAAGGLTVLSAFLVSQQFWFRLVGGSFLVFLGVRTFLTRPVDTATPSNGPAGARGLPGAYFSTFLLTLSNPSTILSFAAIFAGLGVTAAGGPGSGLLLVAGVFCGSALWWLTLSSLVGLFRARLSPAVMRWINRLSGVCIAGFGLVALAAIFTR